MGNADERSAGHPSASEDGLPERRVTVNMVVAYNMAYYRRVAGWTQEQLGEPLGWSKVAVSAAERSWDGKRVRQFDADLIADLAAVLHVPIAALFIPPEDDMVTCRYVLGADDTDETGTMGWLFTHAIPEPTEPAGADDPKTMRAYEGRLLTAMNKYLEPAAAEMVAERLKNRAADQQLAAALREARASRETLDSFYDWIDELIHDNKLLQQFLSEMLKATPEGQALLEQEERRERLERGEPTPEDDELTPDQRRDVWEKLPAAERDWQEKLVPISEELFGERGPVNRGELDRLVAEAHKRGISGPNAARVLLRHDGTYELVRPYPEDQPEGDGQ
jgi:transcriptional regulator with XRE-family HTH domain